MKRLFYLIVVACFVLSATARADRQSELLKKLEESFSSISTVQTAFTQEKKLRVFDRTIQLKGRLAIENPGKLAWRIDEPIRYVLVMDGKQALQWDEESNKVDRMKTTGDPMFEEVLGQIEKWFSGQFSALVKDYDLTIESERPLRLIFVPKEGNLTGKAIKQVAVVIRDDFKYVEQLMIEDVTGDLMTIHFHDTVLNQAVPAAVWKVVPEDE
jgi:outer membrane lipoprotein-sorting protein